MTNLPSGIVAFLFIDIEVSTKLWNNIPKRSRVMPRFCIKLSNQMADKLGVGYESHYPFIDSPCF